MSEFELKDALKNVGEDTLKAIVHNVVRPLIEDIIAKSPNKVDDLLLPFIPSLEAELLKLIDQIDGEPN